MRLSHLSAVAVMIAMVAGLFASFPSAHAAKGDVAEHTAAFCVVNDEAATDNDEPAHRVETQGDGAGTVITVDTGVADDSSTVGDTVLLDESIASIPCTEDQAGKPVSVTPDGTVEPIVEVKGPAVVIAITNDSDGIVKAGGSDLAIKISIKNFPTSPAHGANLAWVRVSGVLDGVDAQAATIAATMDADVDFNGGALGGETAAIAIPAGTAEGEYTISAKVDYTVAAPTEDDEDATDTKSITATKKFTVGDPGVEIAASSLTLDNSAYDLANTVKDETTPETGTKSASDADGIWLRVSTTNSLGNPSNAASVNAITVFATGGATLKIVPSTAAGSWNNSAMGVDMAKSPNSATLNETPTPDNADADDTEHGDEVGSTMFVNVTKTNGKPGTVNVWAIVTGSDGSGTTETLDLVFSGGASSLVLGDVPNSSPKDVVEFTVAANDAGGNKATVSRLRFKVTDADGDAVGPSTVRVVQGKQGDKTPGDTEEAKADDNALVDVGVVTIGDKTASGVYTITVSLVGVENSEATTTATVVGAPANVAVEASATSSDTIGDVITVTATVTDEDGNAVPDKTPVDFDVSSSTGLAGIGKGHGADDTLPTKAGVATAKYAVVGAGTSVISASAEGATGVAVVVSTAGSAEAMADEAMGLSCLSALNAFSTYTCSQDSSASELFGLVSGRGATALHLWNGSAWVRYSVVEGAMVPGSTDFPVSANETLYISY